jgi:hypothetical protein
VRQVLILGATIATLHFLGPATNAAPQTVWQIGKFDRSAAEFNNGKPGSPLFGARYPKNELTYIVGESSPDRDWPAFQPGSAESAGGRRPHPYNIQFNLPDNPRGVYVLKVGLTNIDLQQAGMGETRYLSILQMNVNGHVGRAHQHPQRHDTPGDRHWEDTIEVEIPAGFLRRGTNTLTLTAIDEPAGNDEVSNSGFVFDALELDHDADHRFDAKSIVAQARPTIFYKRQDSGLVELVDVFVTLHSACAGNGQVSLALGGRKFNGTLSRTQEFGEQRMEFEVPEFTPRSPAGIAVACGGHTTRTSLVLDPARKWRLFLVPHEHLDVGFTDYQPKVAEAHNRALDEATEMIAAHPDFRYTADGYWVAERYFEARNRADRDRLLQLIRDKKIFLPAEYANLLTGFPSLETLIRSLSPSFEFAKAQGSGFNYANITDVPSYSWSYASVLAAAGLKYFIAASNNSRGPIFTLGTLDEQSPFWWEGPDGGKVLMWYTKRYAQMARLFGLPPRASTGRDTLPRFLEVFTRPTYKSDSVLVYGAQVENTDLFPQHASIVEGWNQLYAYPQFEYSGFADALQTIAKDFGPDLPVIRGDGGPYWEDGIASDSQFAALDRQTEQRALSAEKLSTLGSLINAHFYLDDALMHRLWQNLVLYDEHTWGSSVSIRDPESQESAQQLEMKHAFATEAKWECEEVLQRSMCAIANEIEEGPGTLVVFNTLNWARSGLVETDMPIGDQIIDLSTGQTIPYQVRFAGPTLARVRFLAEAVPSLGYKCFKFEHGENASGAPEGYSGETIENQFYRITLDPSAGAVKSIFDKELSKELVNTGGPYRFDQYLYVTGGDAPPDNSVLNSEPFLPLPKLTIHGSAGGQLVSITRQPFGTVAVLRSSGVNTPKIETEIILFNGQKKIEFVNHVSKQKVYTKEGVYFAFPLAMNQPQFQYEIQNGVVNPAQDLLPGAGREWFSVQHWVAASQDRATVALAPVDAPLVTLGDIVRGAWPAAIGQREGTIFSYVMNNYWFTNYVAGQGGDFTFRYVLTSGNDMALGTMSRWGWEEMTPLEVDQVLQLDKASAPHPSAYKAASSFLQVDQPNVVLVTWKHAQDGNGSVLRFLEVSGKSTRVTVSSPLLRVKAARRCDVMERALETLPVTESGFTFSVEPHQIVTIRVEGQLSSSYQAHSGDSIRSDGHLHNALAHR